MRVAILSESAADEAALRILVDAVLGVKTFPIEKPSVAMTSIHGVRKTLRTVIQVLHHKSDAEGLVVVVDSNHSSLEATTGENRLREFGDLIAKTRAGLGARSGRPALLIAHGVASPALEGWLLCKRDGQITEAAWEKGLRDKREPYTKLALKRRLLEADYTSSELRWQKMTEAATEVAADIAHLETQFPNGFGSMARQLREWRRLS